MARRTKRVDTSENRLVAASQALSVATDHLTAASQLAANEAASHQDSAQYFAQQATLAESRRREASELLERVAV